MMSYELRIRVAARGLGVDVMSRPCVRYVDDEETLLAAYTSDRPLPPWKTGPPRAWADVVHGLCVVGRHHFPEPTMLAFVVAHEMFHQVQFDVGHVDDTCDEWWTGAPGFAERYRIWNDDLCVRLRPESYRPLAEGGFKSEIVRVTPVATQATADLFAVAVVGDVLGLMDFPPHVVELAREFLQRLGLPHEGTNRHQRQR